MTSGVAQAATAAMATGAAQAADTAKAVDASLTRSELTAPGIRRRRSGRGLGYFAVDGEPSPTPRPSPALRRWLSRSPAAEASPARV
jgi:hypothetical protein